MKKLLLFAAIFVFSIFEIAAQSCTNCENTTNTGINSSAIGTETVSKGHSSFASGLRSQATENFTTALGYHAFATYSKSIAIGSMVKADKEKSIVLGAGMKNADVYLTSPQPRSLIIGFSSHYPTLFVGEAPGFYKTGRIGIGNVTAPEAKLHIRSDAGNSATIYLQPGKWDTASNAQIWMGDKNHGISADFGKGMVFHTRTSYLFNEGNIGIRVTDRPQYLLEVNGTTSTKRLRIYDKENPPRKGDVLTADAAGMASWTDPGVLGGVWQQNANGSDIYFNTGNVGIGTISTYGYKLAVLGKILTDEVMIKHPDDWYDYVLQGGYELQNLSQLERFINRHGHLPDIPSEKEVKTNGIELGKMQGLLLKKIEELTLYTIEQQKMIEEQQKQIKELKELIQSHR